MTADATSCSISTITGLHSLSHHLSQHGADDWIADGSDRPVLAHVDIRDLGAGSFVF